MIECWIIYEQCVAFLVYRDRVPCVSGTRNVLHVARRHGQAMRFRLLQNSSAGRDGQAYRPTSVLGVVPGYRGEVGTLVARMVECDAPVEDLKIRLR